MLVLVKPLGGSMARLFAGERTLLSTVICPVPGLDYSQISYGGLYHIDVLGPIEVKGPDLHG